MVPIWTCTSRAQGLPSLQHTAESTRLSVLVVHACDHADNEHACNSSMFCVVSATLVVE